MRKRKSLILVLSTTLLIVGSLACGRGTKPPDVEMPTSPTQTAAEAPTLPAEPTATALPVETKEEPAPSQTEHDTVFPLPDNVQNFTGEGGESMVNFQTNLSLEGVIDFYRQAFTGQGLAEREILTVIEDDAFSMVFDGSANGKALVIQGVDLGETTNVNIRFEDV